MALKGVGVGVDLEFSALGRPGATVALGKYTVTAAVLTPALPHHQKTASSIRSDGGVVLAFGCVGVDPKIIP